MIGQKMLDHIIDTAHRLAQSRKAVVNLLGVVAGGVVELLPFVVQWLQLLGVDPARQAKIEQTCHLVAATLVGVSVWMSKLIKDEDVATKTPLPPPGPTATATATATDNVTPPPAG